MASPSTIVRKHSLQKAGWNPEYRQALEDYVAIVNYVTMHAYDTMWTSYKNNIQMHMGSSWRRAINELLDCKRRKSEWTARRKAEGASAQVINRECEAHIWAPARHLKEMLCTRHPVGRTPFERAIINKLQPVLDSYDNDYEFAENSIYYDAKANPGKHLKAFIWLEMIFAEWGISCTQALPLRSSWVYAHVPLNTTMLVRCVFGEPYNRISGGKEKIQPHINKYWRRTVDLEQDMFCSHGQYEFMGYTMTDGVSISAVRELVDEESGGKKVCKRKRGQPRKQAQQPQQELNTELAEKKVCKRKRGRRRKQVQPAQQQAQQQAQPQQEQNAEPGQQADCAYIHNLPQDMLQSTAGHCVLVDPGRRDMLYMMHEKSTIEDKKVYRYTRNQQRVETRRRKYQKILENEKPANIAAAERSLNAGSRVVPDLELFKDYLRARALVAVDLTRFYNRTMCNQQVGGTMPEVPLHRKLRLSTYINRQRADQKLASRLRKKFSPNAIFVMGNWSARMARYHEPIRGKGWRTLLLLLIQRHSVPSNNKMAQRGEIATEIGRSACV
ncbi:hypothetical protein IW148_003152 [Coemansia sp. RSA 1199]|nr:hypothetical protein IW148_003152 [Coemansia sp. RSA 1199]